MSGKRRLFLGLDSSTQGVKAVAVDESLRIVHEAGVKYDADLPDYGTEGGVHRGADRLTVTAPPLMWAEALELLFARLKKAGFPFADVAAVSASGQQHGSVFWKKGAASRLAGWRAGVPLREALAGAFAVEASPVWMDSSTTAECRAREVALGGPQAVADITGARAYERFTGNQIARIVRLQPAAYAQTERISLVSSFIASLLCGRIAPIDWSDGSGMNLLDIRRRTWDARSLEVTAPGLADRLGEPVPAHAVVGAIHPALAAAWGFDPACRVIAASGDNPCSLAGLALRRTGDVAVSLGTSDTVFGALTEPHPSGREGHLFVNPVEPSGYMAMICFKNGSLTREAIRRETGAADWKRFGELVARTPPGNGGRLGFYFLEPEITPPMLTTGFFRFGPDDRPVDRFAPEAEARAVLEGQALAMRLHAESIGLRPASLLATGGASVDRTVLRILCDVFGVPVLTGDVPHSAAVGAAYRALHGLRCAEAGQWVPFSETVPAAPGVTKAADPDAAAHAVYSAMMARYGALEARVTA